MNLELLHLEYLSQHPDGLATLRQPHKAGERMQVDFSGKRLWLVDRDSGERTQVDLFVVVLLASPVRNRLRGIRSRWDEVALCFERSERGRELTSEASVQ